MGLFGSMFGGGARLELGLDTTQGSAGGVVAGRVVLHGGTGALRLTTLKVRLGLVSVQSDGDSAFPSVDVQVLAEQTLAAAMPVPPGAAFPFTFRLTVPHGTQPTGYGVSYKILAVADMPGVMDPTADVELNIVDASSDTQRVLPLHEVMARFPGLQAHLDEEKLCAALYDLQIACYSEARLLMEVEPTVAHYMRHGGTTQIKRKALAAWANLIDNRVQPHHLQALYDMANTPGLDDDTFNEVIRAAAMFAEEGAYGLVQQFAQNPSADVRRTVAEKLRYDAATKFNGKRELLMGLAQDADPKVRAAAVNAFYDFNDDQQIMYGVAGQCDRETDPEVQRACINALKFAHHHGMAALSLAVYEKHLANPSEDVRKDIAEAISCQSSKSLQQLWGIVQRLVQDPSEDVRRTMAFQFCNMRDMPQLLSIAQHVADNDPSPAVRKDAIGSIGSLAPAPHAVAYYRHKLSHDTSEETLRAVIWGLRDHNKHFEGQRLLSELGQHQNPEIADAARNALS